MPSLSWKLLCETNILPSVAHNTTSTIYRHNTTLLYTTHMDQISGHKTLNKGFSYNLPVKVLGGMFLSVWGPLPSYEPILSQAEG